MLISFDCELLIIHPRLTRTSPDSSSPLVPLLVLPICLHSLSCQVGPPCSPGLSPRVGPRCSPGLCSRVGPMCRSICATESGPVVLRVFPKLVTVALPVCPPELAPRSPPGLCSLANVLPAHAPGVSYRVVISVCLLDTLALAVLAAPCI